MPSRSLAFPLAALLAAGAAPVPARAFCGFFVSGANAALHNRASQVVLLRQGNRTFMTLSNDYKGPAEDFALVVPVPVVLAKEDVRTLSSRVLAAVDQLTAPRLVEYWEQDPCAQRMPAGPIGGVRGGVGSGSGSGYGRGSGDGGVRIEAQFAVGEYEILILSAEESSGLERWLRARRYNIPKGAAAALAPYVRDGMKFFVAKVNIKKVRRDQDGVVVLSPLRVGYDSPELRLPVRLGLLNANGPQDLVVYVIAPDSRFEVANHPNVFIPTNLEVEDAVREVFPRFYDDLFGAVMAKNPGAVVTEYAWNTRSCDPCPTPPLSPAHLATLGAEGGGGRLVVTRLHARYDRKTLSEDLVFREAPPVEGGRAIGNGGLGEDGARLGGGMNNFQGRYVIRHYWKDKVACEHPNYNVWGGPPGMGLGDLGGLGGPGGMGGGGPTLLETVLAGTKRGKIKLAEAVRTAVPSLGLPGKKRALRPGE